MSRMSTYVVLERSADVLRMSGYTCSTKSSVILLVLKVRSLKPKKSMQPRWYNSHARVIAQR